MRGRIALLALVALLLSASVGVGTATAAQRLNGYSLQGNFMCVSCHEPLNQVSSPEAQNEKATLASLANSGLDIKQIKAQMVSDYGEQVLAEPPAHGVSLLVYILPPLVLIAGLGFLAYNLPRWRRSAQLARLDEPHALMLDPVDANRLDEELRSFDA